MLNNAEAQASLRTVKRAYRCNLVVAGLILFSLAWMFSGITIGTTSAVLTKSRWGMFQFYTIDSNVLMGVAAVLTARAQKAVLSGKRAEICPGIYILKLAGVVGVTLTMLVSLCFLAPTMGGLSAVLDNSTLFLHLINPVFSIFGFLAFERSSAIRRRQTLWGILSVAVYTAYYAVTCALHTTNDVVAPGYDWYGFARNGLRSGLAAIPVLLLVSYGICLALWFLNRPRKKTR